jgi:hypothetical protein
VCKSLLLSPSPPPLPLTYLEGRSSRVEEGGEEGRERKEKGRESKEGRARAGEISFHNLPLSPSMPFPFWLFFLFFRRKLCLSFWFFLSILLGEKEGDLISWVDGDDDDDDDDHDDHV